MQIGLVVMLTACVWEVFGSNFIRDTDSPHFFYWFSSVSLGDCGSTVVKVLCYKSEGRWFDPSWCQWIFHRHKILPITL